MQTVLDYAPPTPAARFEWRRAAIILTAAGFPVAGFYVWADAALTALFASGYHVGILRAPVERYQWECIDRPAWIAMALLGIAAMCVIVQVLRGRWRTRWLVSLLAFFTAWFVLVMMVFKMSEDAFP